jgi:glucose/arabinose dehydrogenase
MTDSPRRGRGRVLVALGALVLTALTLDPDARAATPKTVPVPALAPTVPRSTIPSMSANAAPTMKLALQIVASGLSEPLDVAAPAHDGVLFVVQRTGLVRVVDNGKLQRDPFVDLTKTIKSVSIEQGLLGIAFHPKYPTDRRVFLFHSRKDNDNLLVSYTVAADGRHLDPTSRAELLRVDKGPDAVRHNGGALRFGPDGLLYLSVGDAAAASVNGQNPKTLPGSILRIDIDGAKPYAIPPGNPFADGKSGRPEIFWMGFRNPWRFSIDAKSGNIYVGDVGQETIEEVNVAPLATPGLNFGWPSFEGSRRFYSKITPYGSVVAPVVEVRHDGDPGSCSMTGGEVYRGKAIPDLDGTYFYADWCFGWIRSFRFDGTKATEKTDWSGQLKAEMVSAFGHDADGETLVVDYGAGTVSRIVAAP